MGGFNAVPWYGTLHTHMKNNTVVSLPTGHLLGSYWHPHQPNVDPKVHYWGQLWSFSKLVKDKGIKVYWWNLTFSVWGLASIAEISLVGCQAHTGTPQVTVIKAKLTKNGPYSFKMGELQNFYYWGAFFVQLHLGTLKLDPLL